MSCFQIVLHKYSTIELSVCKKIRQIFRAWLIYGEWITGLYGFQNFSLKKIAVLKCTYVLFITGIILNLLLSDLNDMRFSTCFCFLN
jgi:hypothetical protein